MSVYVYEYMFLFVHVYFMIMYVLLYMYHYHQIINILYKAASVLGFPDRLNNNVPFREDSDAFSTPCFVAPFLIRLISTRLVSCNVNIHVTSRSGILLPGYVLNSIDPFTSPIYLSIYESLYLSIYLTMYLSMYLSI